MQSDKLMLEIADPAVRQAVAENVTRYGLDYSCTISDIIISKPESILKIVHCGDIILSINNNFRIGKLLDFISTYYRSISTRQNLVPVGRYFLDTSTASLVDEKNENITRLTEKEAALLQSLAEAPDGELSREALLEQVWGHQRVLETHTLETHVYRLRQKIETDPAQPALLLTTQKGYCLTRD